jgi:hypothetical protein
VAYVLAVLKAVLDVKLADGWVAMARRSADRERVERAIVSEMPMGREKSLDERNWSQVWKDSHTRAGKGLRSGEKGLWWVSDGFNGDVLVSAVCAEDVLEKE